MKYICILLLPLFLVGCSAIYGQEHFVSKRSADEWLGLAQSSRITTCSVAYSNIAIAMYLKEIKEKIK